MCIYQVNKEQLKTTRYPLSSLREGLSACEAGHMFRDATCPMRQQNQIRRFDALFTYG